MTKISIPTFDPNYVGGVGKSDKVEQKIIDKVVEVANRCYLHGDLTDVGNMYMMIASFLKGDNYHVWFYGHMDFNDEPTDWESLFIDLNWFRVGNYIFEYEMFEMPPSDTVFNIPMTDINIKIVNLVDCIFKIEGGK